MREKIIPSCRVLTHALTWHKKTDVKLHNLLPKSPLQKGGNALWVFYLKTTDNHRIGKEGCLFIGDNLCSNIYTFVII